MKRKILTIIVTAVMLLSACPVFALTSDEAAEQFDFSVISFENIDAVTENLALVTSFKGCGVSWSSNNPEVIAANGVVNRPGVGDAPANVTLTATFTSGGTCEKQFNIVVLPFTGENEILEKIKNDLTFDMLSDQKIENVTRDLYLPSTDGKYASVIKWESSDNSALRIVKDGDNYSGIVTPAHYSDGVYNVLLTATIIYKNSFIKKEFYVKVTEKGLSYTYSDELVSAAGEFNDAFLRNNNILAIRKNLVLPEITNIDVKYKSSNNLVVNEKGEVKRSVGNDEQVSFIVTFSKGYEQMHRIYSLNIKASDSDKISEFLDEDIKWVIENLKSSHSLGNITSDLYFPTVAINGSNIVWSSSNTQAISNSGKVKRGEKDAYVTLTVRVSYAEDYREESVNIVVKAKQEEKKDYESLPSREQSSSGGFASNTGTTPIDNIGIKSAFDDVVFSHWAYNPINYLYNKKIISGVSDKIFAPDGFATREEFVKMLLLSKGMEISEYETRFADVDNSQWYYPYVSTAEKNNIISGISDDKFGVGQNITRQDICVLIYRAFYDNQYAPTAEFNDSANISGYAIGAVSVLSHKGIIKGDGNGNFNPSDNATRAEIAAILYRMLAS